MMSDAPVNAGKHIMSIIACARSHDTQGVSLLICQNEAVHYDITLFPDFNWS